MYLCISGIPKKDMCVTYVKARKNPDIRAATLSLANKKTNINYILAHQQLVVNILI